jgi:hypothetical protein
MKFFKYNSLIILGTPLCPIINFIEFLVFRLKVFINLLCQLFNTVRSIIIKFSLD